MYFLHLGQQNFSLLFNLLTSRRPVGQTSPAVYAQGGGIMLFRQFTTLSDPAPPESVIDNGVPPWYTELIHPGFPQDRENLPPLRRGIRESLTMKKYASILFTALAGGGLSFALRLAQNRTGFEADTGLPVAVNPFALLLPVLLAALALVIFLLTRRLPGEKEDTPLTFTGYFSVRNTGVLTLMVTGIFLWGLSGIADIVLARFRPSVSADSILFAITPRLYILLGILTVLSAGALYVLLDTCRRGGKRR